ncbi:MAG TPA: sialidase family protein [Candidatus Acidoferrales bacterium]|nr:sialidase family protein [Candidatus Acidoferrales bacterium]
MRTRIDVGITDLCNSRSPKWTSGLCFSLLFAILAPFAMAQTLPLAPASHVINLTPHSGFFNEPSIAVNPNHFQQIVAAYQVRAAAAYSTDAGEHWALASGAAPEDYSVSGDVSVTFDNGGRAFLCYIAFDKLGTENYWAHNATRNGIFVRRSLDGGKTWNAKASSVISHPTEPGIPFEDKPYIVADTNPKSPHAGNLYVGWTQFTLAKSAILFSRSTDDGDTWSAPIEISSHEGLPRDDNGAVEGFSGAVASDGTLYVVWADGANIAFTYSKDGGQTFAPSREVLDVAPLYFKVSSVDRANGFPQIALDATTGRLFISWSDYRNGDVDIFVSTSEDSGTSWSSAIRVNSDPIHNGSDQFFQWLAVDPVTGAAYVIFYDRRDDPKNRNTTVVLGRSTDGGRHFQNYAWTRKSFQSRDDFIGDYTGLAAFNGRVYGIWTEDLRSASNATGRIRKRKSPAPPETTDNHQTIVQVGVADFGASN